MTTKIGINGFGRIGRGVFRAGFKKKDIEFVGINDIGDKKTMAHLLKYDSVHGKFPYSVEATEDALIVDNVEIPFFNQRNPAEIPWDIVDTDVVFESTGIFRTYEDASKHLPKGNCVLLSAPAKGGSIKTFVMGVNEKDYDPDKHKVVSNASCTTNCYAPTSKVIDDHFVIEHGLMTTVHSYTSTQNILDLPHKDLRRARAAAVSMIPTTTGAAKAVGLVLPHLDGKLDAISIRVPTPNVSLIDAIYTVQNPPSVEEVNQAFIDASKGSLKGIMAVSEEPLVSFDYNGDPHSVTIDLENTMVNGHLVKVLGWYDNEIGYSSRMIDLAIYMTNK